MTSDKTAIRYGASASEKYEPALCKLYDSPWEMLVDSNGPYVHRLVFENEHWENLCLYKTINGNDLMREYAVWCGDRAWERLKLAELRRYLDTGNEKVRQVINFCGCQVTLFECVLSVTEGNAWTAARQSAGKLMDVLDDDALVQGKLTEIVERWFSHR